MRVMVIGASTDPHKYGHRAVRAYQRQGHEVFAVNLTGQSIHGAPGYKDVADVPGPIDRATLYLPPHVGLTILPELARRGDVAELWVNPGAESPQLMELAEQLGLRVVYGCSIVNIGQRP
jgi:hypothetical protein